LFNFPPGSVLVEDADEEVSEGVAWRVDAATKRGSDARLALVDVYRYKLWPRHWNHAASFASQSLTKFQVMELYMDLASVSSSSADDTPDSGGLGFLDSTKSAIEIEWELSPGVQEVDRGVLKTQGEDTTGGTSGASGASGAGGASGGSRRRTTGTRSLKRTLPNPTPPRSVPVRATIQQDLGALKGRKGDTGERS
jgi:hypothetical protein